MANAIWKPTPAECMLIRQAAVLESCPRASLGQITLSPGLRYNTETDPQGQSEKMNIALVSSLPGWSDTDVADRRDWATFRKGIELNADGVAIIDFYIHARTQAIAYKLEYLLGNVVALYKDGALHAIWGVGYRGHNYLPELLAAREAR